MGAGHVAEICSPRAWRLSVLRRMRGSMWGSMRGSTRGNACAARGVRVDDDEVEEREHEPRAEAGEEAEAEHQRRHQQQQHLVERVRRAPPRLDAF